MQKSNVQQQLERTKVQSSFHSLGAFSIDAANVLSIVGLVFGSILAYQLVFSRPTALGIERAAADEAITHIHAAFDAEP